MLYPIFYFLFICSLFGTSCSNVVQINDEHVDFPTKCESCVIFSRELNNAVAKLPKNLKGDESEAWLIDKLEGICQDMLNFKVHKDKTGLARFSKELSSSMKTIKQLKDRGVQVELGIPEDLWDVPSVEAGLLKQHCEWLNEEFEDIILDWFYKNRSQSIEAILCKNYVAKKFDSSCLPEKSDRSDL